VSDTADADDHERPGRSQCAAQVA